MNPACRADSGYHPNRGRGRPPVGFKISHPGPAYGWLMSLGWEPDAMTREFELGVQSGVADALAGVARFAAVAGTGSPPATELRPQATRRGVARDLTAAARHRLVQPDGVLVTS
jgi:hypothetical protein